MSRLLNPFRHIAENAIFQCAPKLFVYKKQVTERNIGSVFYLLGSDKYPNWDDFLYYDFIDSCLLPYTYQGWLTRKRIPLLKVVHFIAYLSKVPDFWKRSNTCMAETFINQRQLRLLVAALYSVSSREISVVDSAKRNTLNALLAYEEGVYLRKYPSAASQLEVQKTYRIVNVLSGTYDGFDEEAFNDDSGSRYSAPKLIAHPEPVPFDTFIPGFTAAGDPDFEKQQRVLTSLAQYGLTSTDDSPATDIADTTDRPHIPRRRNFLHDKREDE